MREVLTDILDLIGVVAVAIGLGLAAATVWVPLGWLVFGAILLAASATVSTLQKRAVAKARGRR